VVEGPDAPADESLVKAAIQVLKAWTWNERPVAVLGLDAGSHPVLVQSLAKRLATLGRLDDLGFMSLRDDHRGTTAQNSAYRVAALLDAWDVPPVPEKGPILLVAPRTDTGWTLALAAHALRQAGAEAVLPFAVAAVS
jgi:ATP-dependent DNA helicase RecQ